MTSYQESDTASRRGESKGALGCLIPLIASTVILAIAVTLVSWFVLSDEEEDAQNADEESSAVVGDEESNAFAGARDLLEGFQADESGASSQVLLEVVRSANWKEFGQPEVFNLGSQLRVQRKFRRQDEQIQVTIHSLKSKDAAQAVLEQTELPARAVQFDHKVVVLEPITDGSKPMLAPLTERLRKFRELLEGRESSE